MHSSKVCDQVAVQTPEAVRAQHVACEPYELSAFDT